MNVTFEESLLKNANHPQVTTALINRSFSLFLLCMRFSKVFVDHCAVRANVVCCFSLSRNSNVTETMAIRPLLLNISNN